MRIKALVWFLLSTGCTAVCAAGSPGDVAINWVAISFFLLFILITLAITFFAARKTRTSDDFYTADKSITGFQNGVAISGDFMSAATLLGSSALIFATGFDGYVFALGAVLGWPVIMFLIADHLRNLGRYSFADIISYRLQGKTVRVLAACIGLVIILMYLIPQMVGAGSLIQVLFGLPYKLAVIVVGVMMCLYVSFGGMLGTTWVQIIKAVLLLFGGCYLLGVTLFELDFDVEGLFQRAVELHARGEALFEPSGVLGDPITAISFGLTIIFGVAGLPHILIRFFTVPDAREARKSVFYATAIIGTFQFVMLGLGLAAIVYITGQPQYYDPAGRMLGGHNMAVIHLAEALGGDIFLGFISAVAFATILAVVAGLTIAAVSVIVNDIYANVIRSGQVSDAERMRISKITPLLFGAIAILFGLAFEDQNVVILVTTAISVAAGVNFPLLMMAIFWRNFTTRGALLGGTVGLLISLGFVLTSALVWVDVFGNAEALHPYRYSTLFSLTATLFFAWFGSVTDRSIGAAEERERFAAQYIRSNLGTID